MKGHIKSTMLAGLVLVSGCLSYALWHGDWQNSTEVAYTDGTSIPRSDSPRDVDVAQPYEVLFSSVHPNQYALGLPESTLYHDWGTKLKNAHMYGLRSVPVLPTFTSTSVQYKFGAEVPYHDLSRWLPGLPSSALVKTANSVVLYESADKKSVRLALLSDDGSYVADTDFSAVEFAKDIAGVTTNHRWAAWDVSTDSLVPKDGLTMFQIRYKSTQPQILPIVHSFFVNPQALSRIQEDKETVLFTDGSRVVWWDQSAEILTFANPNPTGSSPTLSTDLESGLEFIRNHGGTPDNVLAVLDSTSSKSTVFTLRTYVDGFPILGPEGEYSVEMDNGRVMQYQRPLRELGVKQEEAVIHTLGADQLSAVLHGLMPSTPLQAVVVQLGYIEQAQSDNSLLLTPIYYISESGTPLYVLDASNGKVMKGMNAQ